LVHPFERFSDDAKKVLTISQEEAERAHHSYIGTEHLLVALLLVESQASRILAQLGVELDLVRATLESVLGRAERVIIQQIIPTTRVKKVIELSFEAALGEGAQEVGPQHLLIGLLEEGNGIAAHVLKDLGATLERVRSVRVDVPLKVPPAWPVGTRVLVHDPEPPYRLWEGSIVASDEGHVSVAVPLHPTRPEARVPASELHFIPLRSQQRPCDRCRWRPSPDVLPG
jgi:hypothetical protein